MVAILTVNGRLLIVNADSMDSVLQRTDLDAEGRSFGQAMDQQVNLMPGEIVEVPMPIKAIAQASGNPGADATQRRRPLVILTEGASQVYVIADLVQGAACQLSKLVI